MNVNTNFNYLTNSVALAKQFAKQVATNLRENVERKPWGQYKSGYGPAHGSAGEYPSGVAAAVGLDALTDATRRQIWKYTNMYRLMGDLGQTVSNKVGLESPLSGAVVAAAVPLALGSLSGQIGSPIQGMRPAGYKAVAPVSKEEDPTGRKTRSVVLEAAMRYGLGQRSQLLPYQEFKKEQPDVLPSTYTNYRKYLNLKPEAGYLTRVDPNTQSFSALNGIIRGTGRGLNDPEIRLKGVPVTASAAIGTAVGLGAIKGLSSTLNPETTFGPAIHTMRQKVRNAQELFNLEALKGPVQGTYVQDLENKKQLLTAAEQARNSVLSPVAQQFQKLGGLKEPALIAAGATAAVVAARATKKLFQKAEERRVKKENPVEYLKHKHGSLDQARATLQQPEARSWQDLTPYV